MSAVLTEEGRVCRGCGLSKPWAAFFRNPRGINKRDSRCRVCHAKKAALYNASSNGRAVKTRNQGAYRKRHPDRAAAATKRWLADHPTYERDRAKRRYAANPQQRLAASRKWAVKNPLLMRAYSRARRARVLRAIPPDGGLTPADWCRVLSVYAGRCAYCFAVATCEMDHVVPLAKGGLHVRGNVVPACTSCNRSKSDRLLEVWLWPPLS